MLYYMDAYCGFKMIKKQKYVSVAADNSLQTIENKTSKTIQYNTDKSTLLSLKTDTADIYFNY